MNEPVVPPSRSSSAVVVAVLLFLSLLIAFLRLHTYNEPLDRDLAAYAVIAHEMLGGRPLYADLWDHKPPAIHVTFALGEWLCGYGPQSIYFLNVAAAILTLLGVYAAGAAHPGQRRAGLWAALFWALLSNNLFLEANQPNTEVFINACLMGAFALLVRARQPTRGIGRAALVGLLLALASLYKQVVLPIALLLGGTHVLFPPGEVRMRRRALLQTAVMLGVIALSWAGVLLCVAVKGHWVDFSDAVFQYNRHYAGNTLANTVAGLVPNLMLGLIPLLAPLLCLLAGVGCLLGLTLHNSPLRLWGLWTAYAAGTYLAVQLPGKWFPHYYQLWLPILAVAAGWCLTLMQRLVGESTTRVRPWVSRFGPSLISALGVLTVGQLTLAEVASYQWPAEEWSRKKFGPQFVEMKQLGEAISEVLLPNETLYVFGSESELYVYSRRRPTVGVLYNFPLLSGPLAEALSQRTLAELRAAPPEIVVICFDRGPPDGQAPSDPAQLAEWLTKHPIAAWCLEHYEPHPTIQAGKSIVCYVRRGGALAGRLGLTGRRRPEAK
jgi:hypothetical protein